MRQILFRAKRIDNGEWVEGSFIDSGNHEQVFIYPHYDGASTMPCRNLVYHRMIAVDVETLSQYTGLTDKNGNKIWENDIIQYIDGELSVNGVVRFGRHEQIVMLELGFYVEWVSDEAISFKTDVCYWVEKRDIEVIGNIFDNEDLLKGE